MVDRAMLNKIDAPVFDHRRVKPVEGEYNARTIVDTALRAYAFNGAIGRVKYGFSQGPSDGLQAAVTALRIRDFVLSLGDDAQLIAQDARYNGKGYYVLSPKEGADCQQVFDQLSELMSQLMKLAQVKLQCEESERLVASPSYHLVITLYGVRLVVGATSTPQSLRESYQAGQVA